MKNFKKTKGYIVLLLALLMVLLNVIVEAFAESGTGQSLAVPDSDGRYYLTECEKPAEKCDVNLAGTGYDHALFNPKTNMAGTTVPWYISLGGAEAMCMTYNGHASTARTSHHYVRSDISSLKKNPYFQGGMEYPLENYLKGVCYAYETLAYPEQYITKSYLDADRAELIRKTNANMVWYSGRAVNYAVHQIITWRIASGSFNPENLEYEHNLAKVVFGQMYPGSEWENYERIITEFYDYYVLCANEAASGDYAEKYEAIQIQYWIAQNLNEFTDLSEWQDFITWDVPELPAVPGGKTIDVYKYGTNTDTLIPGAVYGVYSDSECTNKIGAFTTNASGYFEMQAIEGIYYLKEITAPEGTVLDDTVYTLNVRDDTDTFSVYNNEIGNYLEFYKYEEATGNIIVEEAEFDLYEYNRGTKSYLRMGALVYGGDGKYLIQSSQNYTYHSVTGAVTDTINADCLFYTDANQGKFKIVEVSPPKGWEKADDKEFIMNASVHGYVLSFQTYETGIVEKPYYCGISLAKYDSFTAAMLSGAEFKIQEMVDGKWYDVGKLEETVNHSESGVLVSAYVTSKNQEYSFHDSSGGICQTINDSDFPMHKTTYNNGQYRLVETKTANEFYAGGWTKIFMVQPAVPDTMFSFLDIGTAATNRGNGNMVITSKYDGITGEPVASAAVITVYEHIKTTDEWLEVGTLNYDEETCRYTTQGKLYRPHNEDGTYSKASVGQTYLPGYLYYTSANEGRYKLVETKAPEFYESGIRSLSGIVQEYVKEFFISEIDKEILDFTDFSNAIQDMGISSDVELSKYDAVTKTKIPKDDAVFTVYEHIETMDEWLAVGTMVYDRISGIYTAKGMKMTLHDSKGEPVYQEEYSQGLYYTTANQGKYKVVETAPPSGYITGSVSYVREFNVATDAVMGKITLTEDNAPFNLGVSGKVIVAKYDAVTREKVLSKDVGFTVYEHIEATDEWLEMGMLRFDETAEEYVCEGQFFRFHDNAGNELDVVWVKDFETGKLYRTTANQGRFKVVETMAPANYNMDGFEKEFIITADNTIHTFNTGVTGAVNQGVSGKIMLVKSDSQTDRPLMGAVFVLQEWSVAMNQWVDAGILTDNLDGTYTSDNCRIHTGVREETLEFGSLIYTTQNLGKFRVVEKEAPEGYVNEGFVSDELILSDETREFIFENESMVKNIPIRISVSKKSLTSGNDISGARLTIKDLEGNTIDTWISDGTDHMIAAIPAGRYTLIEEYAPEGYLIAGKVEFEVKETDEIQKVEMYDERVMGKLVVDKVDKITGAGLAGAEFVLKDEEGNVIQTLVTDENGHTESELLDFGIYDENGKYLGSKKYTLTETISPKGYIADETPVMVEFEYKDDRTGIIEVEMTIENEREPEVPTGDNVNRAVWLIMIFGAGILIVFCMSCDT